MKLFKEIKLYLVFIILILSPSLVYANRLYSSDTLINNSQGMDGKLVCLQGEVVGDMMVHGKYCWINIYDGSQALGVYAPRGMVQSIRFLGDYKHTGDIIEVWGTFHKACKLHKGELDIHAEKIRMIRTGSVTTHPLNKSRVYFALSLLLSTLLIIFLYNYRKKFSS